MLRRFFELRPESRSDGFAASIAQSIFLLRRRTSHGWLLAGIIKLCVSVYTEATRETGSSAAVAVSAVGSAVRYPRCESSHPSPLPRIQRNVVKRQEGARVDWSGEPGSMARGGAGSFARLVVPL